MSSIPLIECFFIILGFVLVIDLTKIYTKKKLFINTIKEEFKYIFISTFVYLNLLGVYILNYRKQIFINIFNTNQNEQVYTQILFNIVYPALIALFINSLLYLGVLVQWFYVRLNLN